MPVDLSSGPQVFRGQKIAQNPTAANRRQASVCELGGLACPMKNGPKL